jgi:hypothetical protein
MQESERKLEKFHKVQIFDRHLLHKFKLRVQIESWLVGAYCVMRKGKHEKKIEIVKLKTRVARKCDNITMDPKLIW